MRDWRQRCGRVVRHRSRSATEFNVLPIDVEGSDSPRARRLAAMNDERSPSTGGLGAGGGATGGAGAGSAGRSGSGGAVATTGGVGAGGGVGLLARAASATTAAPLSPRLPARLAAGGDGADGACCCAGAMRTANRSPILLSSAASPGQHWQLRQELPRAPRDERRATTRTQARSWESSRRRGGGAAHRANDASGRSFPASEDR